MSTNSAKEKYFLLQVQYRKDPEAFARLYDMYVSRIFRFIYFKVSSEEDAQDLTAEVFLKAWEYIKKQDKKIVNFKALLYQIARNLVIDFYRERNKDRAKITDEEQMAMLKDVRDLEADVSAKMELVTVENALNKLKEEYKEIIILKHVEEFTITEICAILDKKNSAVRVLLHRATKALKEVLGE